MKTSIVSAILFASILAVSAAFAVPAIGTTEQCVAARKAGLLTATISNGVATITNNADQSFEVGLAVYRKFDENISNQIIYDWTTGIATPGQTQLSVELPACAYQIDLFCGEVLQSLYGYPNVQYGDRKIAWKHIGKTFCEPDTEVPEFGLLAGSMTAVAGIGLLAFRRK